MTEEIIKECEFYLPFSENCNEILDDNGNEIYKCSSRQDCYYKQLIRLEQENKELSFAIEKCLENAGIECDDEEQALRSLPDLGASHYKVLQENKELKKQYNCYACDTCNGKEDYRNMKRHCENAIKTVHKYRSALEEIKRILIVCLEFRTCEKCEFYKECNKDLEGCIIDRINEVLE